MQHPQQPYRSAVEVPKGIGREGTQKRLAWLETVRMVVHWVAGCTAGVASGYLAEGLSDNGHLL